MGTQGILSIVKDDKVLAKVVVGQDGGKLKQLAGYLTVSGSISNAELQRLCQEELKLNLQSLVIQFSPTTFYSEDGDSLAPIWTVNFPDPCFNPRWHYGTADHTYVVDMTTGPPSLYVDVLASKRYSHLKVAVVSDATETALDKFRGMTRQEQVIALASLQAGIKLIETQCPLTLNPDGTDTLYCKECEMTVQDGEEGRHKGDSCPHCVPPTPKYVMPSGTVEIENFTGMSAEQQLEAISCILVASKLPDMELLTDILVDIDILRKDEGDSLQILCDNPEEDDSQKVAAVEVSADWTDWKPERFYGPTWQKALHKAARTRRRRETDFVGGKRQAKHRIRTKGVQEGTVEPLYWSHGQGWVSGTEHATLFSGYERQTFNLPMEGEWEEVPQEKGQL